MTETLFLTRSKTRRDILGFLFEHPGEEFYLRDLTRRLGYPVGNVRRELLKLKAEEVLLERRQANLCFYRLNTVHPLYTELKGIVQKTAGIRQKLAAIFGKTPAIVAAFIYGSFAKETESGGSDIDVVIIGNLSAREVSGLERNLTALEKMFAREINSNIFTVVDFTKKAKDPASYVREVVREKKVFLVGDEEKLRTLIR